jgi:2-polyprenyl-3-methyl-5-hydroxy-6-metoxy-1,4-benzoquinol methylase
MGLGMRGKEMIGSTRLEDVSCPLGCPESDDLIFTGRDQIHDHAGEFNIVKCRTCDLMRVNPRPSPDSIDSFYPDNYGPYLGTKVNQYESTSRMKSFTKTLLDLIANNYSQKLPLLAPGRMLELGCASGSYLRKMAQQGWHVKGVEYSEKAAQEATQLGYDVYAGPLETAPNPDAPFDLIVGWMVLEHLHDPIGCLRKLHGWIKPSGYLVLSVPNVDSIGFRVFKKYCYSNHLPNHLFHFTPETLSNVLLASGWDLEKIYHQRTLNDLIASTGYFLRDKGYAKLGQKLIAFPERGGWVVYALYPLAWLFSVFGQTGRMTVWARVK